jgi:hypothetical protein
VAAASTRPTTVAAASTRPTTVAAASTRPTTVAAASTRPTTVAEELQSDSQTKGNLINTELSNTGLNVKKYSNLEEIKTILKKETNEPNQSQYGPNIVEVNIKSKAVEKTGNPFQEFYQLKESLVLLRQKLKDIQNKKSY